MATISFDVEVARRVTVEGAIILNHIYFWVRKNQLNNVNYHEGKYWTYNSCKGFADYFQCITERVISLRLKKLEEDGYIETGLHSKNTLNRTKWYTLTPKGYQLLNHQMFDDSAKMSDDSSKMSEPISQTVKTDLTNGENTPDGMLEPISQTVKTDFTNGENHNRYKTITDRNYTNKKQTDRTPDRNARAREEGSNILPEGQIEEPQMDVQEQRFRGFWRSYPRKQGKGAAEKAWEKIRPDGKMFEKILSAIDAAKRSMQWRRDNGQYIPNPATWLNQRRWEDELEPVSDGDWPVLDNPQIAIAQRAMEMLENES